MGCKLTTSSGLASQTQASHDFPDMTQKFPEPNPSAASRLLFSNSNRISLVATRRFCHNSTRWSLSSTAFLEPGTFFEGEDRASQT
jgi:hypothetical protein